MKKVLAFAVAGVMALSLCACGGSSSSSTAASSTKAESTTAASSTKAESTTAASSTKEESTSTGTHEQITIKLQGAFAEGADHYYYFDQFCETVNELSEGSVTVVWGAGPEAIPTDQLAEAMQNGIVELVYSPCTFLTSVVPALGGVKLVDAIDARTNGADEYIDSITESKLSCHFLGRTAVNSPYVITSNVEITSLDSFKGVVFRGTAAHRPLLEALGAEVVTMGWADVYSAVDKNVVQGVGGTYRDFVDNDLGGKVKYLIDPGFYCSDSSLFISDAVWNKLDDVQKAALEQAAQDWENDSATYNEENNEKDIATLEAAGTEVISLADLGCEDEFIQTAYDAAWDQLEADAPDEASEFRQYSKY